MQLAINIFTFIGSILGIIAFFLTVFSTTYEYNVKHWEKLTEIIDFNEFEEFYQGISIGIVYSRTSDKYKDLVKAIRINSEEIYFKGLSGKKIKKQFQIILAESNKYYSEVQAPKWDIWKEGRDDIERKINIDYFDSKYKNINEHAHNIDLSIKIASECVEKIIDEYRHIYIRSNRTPIQILLKKN